MKHKLMNVKKLAGLLIILLLLCLSTAKPASANFDDMAVRSDLTAHLNDSNSPLRARVALDTLPTQGDTANIHCAVKSFIHATNVTAQIELPADTKLISGSLDWHGTISANQEIQFSAQVQFDRTDDTTIHCRTHQQLDEQNSFGDLATIYISIGADQSRIGFKPIPIAEQIQLAGLQEAGDGQPVPQSATAWQWNYANRQTPPPPSLEAQPENQIKPLTTNRAMGDLTITGSWHYFDRDDNYRVIREQLVEIVRGDNGDHLKWCYTNVNGDFSCGPFTNPGSAGVRAIIHTYTIYNPNDDKLIVKNPDYSGVDPSNSFRVQTGVQSFSDGTHSIGTWHVNNDSSYERAYWTHRDLVDTWRFIVFNGDISGATPGPSTVLWKPDSTDGAYYNGQVHLRGEDPLSDTVVIHEYAHNIMDNVYSSYPSTPNCNPHTIQGTSSAGCAWSEGWAEFIPSVVNNDPTYRWASGASLNLENPTWETFGWDDGDDVEGRVAGSLWDMYDNANEDDDQYTESDDFAPFWDIFYNQDDANFYWHWQAWLAYGYDNSSAGPLMSMYQSTIDYRLGPSNDDFANAHIVGSLPYTLTNWDTTGATTQGDDPDHPCGAAYNPQQSRTVWYQFTSDLSASYNINTTNTTYDTVLAVWSGSFGSLTNIACNDDSNGTLQSELDVVLPEGTTYYISVARYGNASAGDLDLNMSMNPPIAPTNLTVTAVDATPLTLTDQDYGFVDDQHQQPATNQALFNTQVYLNWDDNSLDEYNYHVERWDGSNWVEIIYAIGDSVYDTDIETDQTYYYRVRGHRHSHDYAYSDYSNITGVYVPPYPTAIQVDIDIVDDDIRLSWTDYVSNTGGYDVWRHTTPYFDPANNGTLIDNLPSGTETFTDTNVLANGVPQYFYLVVAKNSIDQKATSNDVFAFSYELTVP
ncbi:MAG TPA: hypothetical protein VLL52_00195 [Anaerolineae bacterium]|nr:hypothetical protein [Anaerolineae bacterium]